MFFHVNVPENEYNMTRNNKKILLYTIPIILLKVNIIITILIFLQIAYSMQYESKTIYCMIQFKLIFAHFYSKSINLLPSPLLFF